MEFVLLSILIDKFVKFKQNSIELKVIKYS